MSNNHFKIDLTEGRDDYEPPDNMFDIEGVTGNIEETIGQTDNTIGQTDDTTGQIDDTIGQTDDTVQTEIKPINTGKKELPMDKEFPALLLINLYEYFLGLVFGFLFNEFMYLIFPFNKDKRPNVFISFIVLIIFVTIIITIALILRKSSMFLPYISDLRKTYKLNPPPPIAMTFSLWRTINQLKKRSKYIQERIFEVSK